MNYRQDEDVIFLTAPDPVTMDDIAFYADASRVIHDHATKPIFTMFDASHTRAIPQGAMRGRSNPEFTHPMAAGIVIFGANLLVRTITGVIARLAGMDRVHYFGTEEEAWEFVRSHREANPETLPSRRRALPVEVPYQVRADRM